MFVFTLLVASWLAGNPPSVDADDESRLAAACGMTVSQLRVFADACERGRKRAIREVTAQVRAEAQRLPDLTSADRQSQERRLIGYAQWLSDLKTRQQVAPPEFTKLTIGEIGGAPKSLVKIVHIVNPRTARVEFTFRSGKKSEALLTNVTTDKLQDGTVIHDPFCYRVVQHEADKTAAKGPRTIPVLEVFNIKPVAEYLRLKYKTALRQEK